MRTLLALFGLLSLAVIVRAAPPPKGARTKAATTTPAAAFQKILDAKHKTKDGKTEPVISGRARRVLAAYPAHIKQLFQDAAKRGKLHPRQVAGFLSLRLNTNQIGLLLKSNCVLCHTNPDEVEDKHLLFVVRPADKNGRAHGPNPLIKPAADPNPPAPTPAPGAPGSPPTAASPKPAPKKKLFVPPSQPHNLAEFVTGVHFQRGLMCSGCHGGNPKDAEMSEEIGKRWPQGDTWATWNGKLTRLPKRKVDRSWIPGFCTERCHSQPSLMRAYNPKLPVDQYVKYRDSRHGKLLLGKPADSTVAQCTSCHGVHGILPPTSPNSMVFPKNIPATCGRCHSQPAYMKGRKLPNGSPFPTDQEALYRRSVHGQKLLVKDDLSAPVCNDCHGNHAAMPPQIASLSQICRNCHVSQAKRYDGSPHKQAFVRLKLPECATCHSNHLIQPATDTILFDERPAGLCQDCHRKHAGAKAKTCIDTAAFFRRRLRHLKKRRESIQARIKRAARQGISVVGSNVRLAELSERAKELRASLHSFDARSFERAARKVDRLLNSVQAELRAATTSRGQRRTLLLVSTFFLTLLVFSFYVKLRQVERKK